MRSFSLYERGHVMGIRVLYPFDPAKSLRRGKTGPENAVVSAYQHIGIFLRCVHPSLAPTAGLKSGLYAHRRRAECGFRGRGCPVDRIDIHGGPPYHRAPIHRIRRLNFLIFAPTRSPRPRSGLMRGRLIVTGVKWRRRLLRFACRQRCTRPGLLAEGQGDFCALFREPSLTRNGLRGSTR